MKQDVQQEEYVNRLINQFQKQFLTNNLRVITRKATDAEIFAVGSLVFHGHQVISQET